MPNSTSRAWGCADLGSPAVRAVDHIAGVLQIDPARLLAVLCPADGGTPPVRPVMLGRQGFPTTADALRAAITLFVVTHQFAAPWRADRPGCPMADLRDWTHRIRLDDSHGNLSDMLRKTSGVKRLQSSQMVVLTTRRRPRIGYSPLTFKAQARCDKAIRDTTAALMSGFAEPGFAEPGFAAPGFA